ncbi:MAG: hypothetical protein P8X57_14720, partial [Cyclobacteriaceae bacterium]
GKQWSTYYDITGYTDKFNVFGGRASATYTGTSDGGETGTGRASQAVTYRNSFGNLSLGGQLQFRNGFNDRVLDGFGFSAQYEIFTGLRLGAAYNKAYFLDQIIDNTNGFGGQPEYLTFGMSFLNETWDIGVVYSSQTNGDVTRAEFDQELISSVYDADGLEVFAKFMQPRYAIILGYNGYNPDVNNLPIDNEYDRQDFIIGGEFRPTKYAYFYSEWRISNGTDAFGFEDTDVFTMGVRLDLNRTYSKYIK